ncbi:winged helix DNA-binding domain-containing protein [Tessaracoccus sp. MC1679]|uniref:winged helix DNA-binding domain-containing protein n=1 Tax=Tessaracoccus sp. MC1679 TaxID=2760313 RepID=UPI001C71D4BF|nr:winged helix DNA-binding domain-containing protein [Tessaracoccus sp. MC1679]
MSPGTSPDARLGRLRLVAQGLITRPFGTPADAVAALGAMQGQDLPGVLASAALRTPLGIEAVLSDVAEGRLVRGYPMRGTVFLLPAADAAWITELCARPAMRAASARSHQLELDEAQILHARDRATEALDAGPMPRAALFDHWEAHGLRPKGGRGYHLLFHLIAGGTLCYGPWNGADQDVVLAARWLPAGSSLESRFNGDRVAAVAELLRRYLTSHGPATIRDFAWWTKLGLGEIRSALPLVLGDLEGEAGGQEASHWRPGLVEEAAELGRRASAPLLLPGFDEFVLGYQDRLFALTAEEHHQLVPGNNGVFKKSIVASGLVRGIWTRAGRPGARRLETVEFTALSPTVRRQLAVRFAAFPFVAP